MSHVTHAAACPDDGSARGALGESGALSATAAIDRDRGPHGFAAPPPPPPPPSPRPALRLLPTVGSLACAPALRVACHILVPPAPSEWHRQAVLGSLLG